MLVCVIGKSVKMFSHFIHHVSGVYQGLNLQVVSTNNVSYSSNTLIYLAATILVIS